MNFRYLNEECEYIYGTHMSKSFLKDSTACWYNLLDDENETVATIEPHDFNRLEVLDNDEWKKFTVKKDGDKYKIVIDEI